LEFDIVYPSGISACAAYRQRQKARTVTGLFRKFQDRMFDHRMIHSHGEFRAARIIS
jgi:hypothetical protein